jgi:hypothetical protein
MLDSERTGGKYINIRIQRSTHQQLIDLAGPDLPPEQCLENIVNQIATGTPMENLKQTSTIMQAPLMEITSKLAVLSDGLRRLTEITLENRRAIETMQAMLTPLPLGRPDSFSPGFKRPDKPGEPQNPVWEKPYYPPQFPDNRAFPVSSPANISDESGDEGAGILADKIKKYEEENPW